MELVMTAKKPMPSNDITLTTVSGAASAHVQSLDSSDGSGDITRLPDYWTNKETVNEAKNQTPTGKINPAEVQERRTASDSNVIQKLPGKPALTETPSTKDVGSVSPSSASEVAPEADETATINAANWSLEKAKSLIGYEVGPYLVTGELGHGGMGVVYRARHKLLRREVALKIILGSGGDSEVISRFREEARSVATLKHPGIVQIHEYSEHQGIPWFSLELVNGKTLSQLIATEPMDPRRAARIMADVASAVGYAHDRGVLHRDIKPANVLVAEGDIAKLTDFGLAKQVTSEKEASNEKTIEGQIMGTPGFMSPEQARGIVGELGPFSDQYSLGATLYCLLTGRAPFVGTPIDVVVQVINNDPLTVRQLQPSTPLDLETICLKAMSKEPSHRYPDCAAFEADLRRFLRNEPIHARPVGNVERIIRWCRRNPRVAIPAMTTVLSVLTALGISLWSAVTLSAKNTAIRKQNQEITQQNQEITIQRGKLKAENDRALANEIVAKENEQKAFQRGVEAKDAVAEMMTIVRIEMPSSEEKLRKPRETLLRRALKLLDTLPDNPGDAVLRTGLEKARILQEQYYTALDLGEHSKAIEYLDAAENILRLRNVALGSTDASRKNLQSVLYHQTEARTNARRNMEKVCQICKESASLLNDVLENPNPVEYDVKGGSVDRLGILEAVMIQGYQHALTLKNLGRVQEGLTVIDRALDRFNDALAILRKGQYKELSAEQWEVIKKLHCAQLSDQYQLRAILLASVGRDQEARDVNAWIMSMVRQFAESQSGTDNDSKLSLALLFSGDLARQRGQIDEAIAAYDESMTITRKLYAEYPKLKVFRSRHNVSLMRLAGLVRFRDLPRARQLYSEARQIAQEMVQADTNAIGSYFSLALVSPFSGPPKQAVELAEEILKRIEPGTSPDAELLVNVARVFAASADAEGLSENPNTEEISRWRTRALSFLEDALKEGYRDGIFLDGEPDLASLRSAAEFNAILAKCKTEVTASTN